MIRLKIKSYTLHLTKASIPSNHKYFYLLGYKLEQYARFKLPLKWVLTVKRERDGRNVKNIQHFANHHNDRVGRWS